MAQLLWEYLYREVEDEERSKYFFRGQSADRCMSFYFDNDSYRVYAACSREGRGRFLRKDPYGAFWEYHDVMKSPYFPIAAMCIQPASRNIYVASHQQISTICRYSLYEPRGVQNFQSNSHDIQVASDCYDYCEMKWKFPGCYECSQQKDSLCCESTGHDILSMTTFHDGSFAATTVQNTVLLFDAQERIQQGIRMEERFLGPKDFRKFQYFPLSFRLIKSIQTHNSSEYLLLHHFPNGRGFAFDKRSPDRMFIPFNGEVLDFCQDPTNKNIYVMKKKELGVSVEQWDFRYPKEPTASTVLSKEFFTEGIGSELGMGFILDDRINEKCITIFEKDSGNVYLFDLLNERIHETDEEETEEEGEKEEEEEEEEDEEYQMELEKMKEKLRTQRELKKKASKKKDEEKEKESEEEEEERRVREEIRKEKRIKLQHEITLLNERYEREERECVEETIAQLRKKRKETNVLDETIVQLRNLRLRQVDRRVSHNPRVKPIRDVFAMPLPCHEKENGLEEEEWKEYCELRVEFTSRPELHGQCYPEEGFESRVRRYLSLEEKRENNLRVMNGMRSILRSEEEIEMIVKNYFARFF